MRHRVEGRKFGRERDHRKALMRNLVISLITHERITTTLAKAKETRSLAERVITYGKKGEVHHRRLAFRILHDRDLVKRLFDDIAPRFSDRNGGYTRIYKKGFRKGDCAPMAIIELVDKGTAPEKSADKIKSEDLTK
ncbi:MAG: 50S ribosomal protein L17 [Candidatus Cloacimonetes bacterium]|nr:50S ribosomal protein L17 [Candidatus Cloacimonadota bacterium]